MEATMKKNYHVVCAVTIKDGRLYCCRRGPGRALEGFWEFPGGKIEPGEEPRTALEREIREELKAEVAVGEHIATSSHDYGSFSIMMEAFLCKLTGKEPTLTEHTESRWLRKNELDSVEWAPADRPIVESVKKIDWQ